MIRRLDHVVILVDQLDAAIKSYEQLGFQVVFGGEHADGHTHNALVSFADGTYLELLAFKREAPGHHWWRHMAAGPGLIDFALLPDAIEADVAAARARGLDLIGPQPGGRARPDGVRLEWQTAMPPSPDLPFLCADVTPRDLRVPGSMYQVHINHVASIFKLSVAVRDLDLSAQHYVALLGTEPIVEPGRRLFRLGNSYIALRSPGPDEPESAALAEQLARRGEGIYSLTLSRGNLSGDSYTLDPALACRARIAIV